VNLTVSLAGSTLASGTSSINTILSLAAYDGSSVDLTFDASDSRGQLERVRRTVFVEGSTHLAEVAAGEGLALDYDGHRLLFIDSTVSPAQFIQRTVGGSDQIVPVEPNGSPSVASLSPTGVLYVAWFSGLNPTLYEWRNGSLTSLGGLSAFQVNGNFAAYSPRNSLHRRDLLTGSEILISASTVDVSNYYVASNGDVVFADGRISWYRGGSLSVLPSVTGALDSHPVTDGTNVLFCRDNGSQSSIVRSDGSSEEELATIPTSACSAGSVYAANGGWIAFLKPDGAGFLQAWIRAPDGTLRQLSQFGTSSRIEALADDGAVVFRNTKRYYATAAGAITGVSSILGKVLWRDGAFELLLGRSAFLIVP